VGPLWKQTPISRALLSISFGVPSKGALSQGSPHRAPSERDAPFLEPSFIHLSKFPGIRSTFQVAPIALVSFCGYVFVCVHSVWVLLSLNCLFYWQNTRNVSFWLCLLVHEMEINERGVSGIWNPWKYLILP